MKKVGSKLGDYGSYRESMLAAGGRPLGYREWLAATRQ